MTQWVADDRPLGPVPRTTEAIGAAAASRAAALRVGRPPAWWGMVILVASEGTLFGVFIGTYYYLRFHTRIWPPDGIPRPAYVVPLVLVGCLAATSLPMQLASNAAHAGRLAATRLFLALALIVQTGYVAYEIHDYADQLHRVDITRDAYSSIYYTLLGADHGHVILGVLFNLWLLGKLARGLTTYRLNAVRAITFYWYFVNVLTIVVLGVLLSARA
jgi:heme/copper-type cytochrome/quinol oxidase subunit 3